LKEADKKAIEEIAMRTAVFTLDADNSISANNERPSFTKINNYNSQSSLTGQQYIQSKGMKKNYSIDIGETRVFGPQSLSETVDAFAKKADDLEAEEEEEELRTGKPGRICCTSLTAGMKDVRPIGWMAIFGDGLGNFIDGLGIGASINQSLVGGLTTAFASWCGNIPQELGDFALLVRAGMTPFQALFYNFMSAQTAYLGRFYFLFIQLVVEY
jgi:zinc transporter ZupT